MEKVIKTVPPTVKDIKLQEKFAELITGQNELLDNLARQMLTLELAVPGLYATVLKLVSGDKATLPQNVAFWLTFGAWLLALFMTMLTLFPRKWKVNPQVMQNDPANHSHELGIEDFFRKSADYKRLLLLFSGLLFFAGIISAAFVIL